VRRTFNLAEKYGVKFEKPSHSFLELYPQLNNKNDNVLETLIKLIRSQAQELNVGIDNEAPWKETDEAKRNEIVSKYLVKVFELANLLEPVMPKTALAIFKSVDESGKITNPPILFPKKV
jgi:methionyl-tRNA synthetase